MTSIALWSLLVNLVWVGAALLVARAMLLWFDRRHGIDFRGWWNDSDALARAVYLAARILAVFYVVGTVIRPPV